MKGEEVEERERVKRTKEGKKKKWSVKKGKAKEKKEEMWRKGREGSTGEARGQRRLAGGRNERQVRGAGEYHVYLPGGRRAQVSFSR